MFRAQHFALFRGMEAAASGEDGGASAGGAQASSGAVVAPAPAADPGVAVVNMPQACLRRFFIVTRTAGAAYSRLCERSVGDELFKFVRSRWG